jgi:hypothetical protein
VKYYVPDDIIFLQTSREDCDYKKMHASCMYQEKYYKVELDSAKEEAINFTNQALEQIRGNKAEEISQEEAYDLEEDAFYWR